MDGDGEERRDGLGKILLSYHTAAVLHMVQASPGIKRSRLYASGQDMERVDELVRKGLIQPHEGGYVISIDGEGARRHLEATIEALGVSEYLSREIARLESRYSRRLVRRGVPLPLRVPCPLPPSALGYPPPIPAGVGERGERGVFELADISAR